MKRSTALALGGAFLIGAALAFPAGWILAGRSHPHPAPVRPVDRPHDQLINPYAPNITQDPYFIEQEQKGLETLERSCRTSGKFCREAKQLRAQLGAGAGAP